VGDRGSGTPPAEGIRIESEARLLEQIRSGDADAAGRFVREQYPGIYRYLLYLTGQPDRAADLTQETFFQAWRHLDSFEGRASLKTWLHRIAHREFLAALRRQRDQSPLEETADASAPEAAAWLDRVELREVIDRLPREQREVVLLHYLEGYSSSEIARIVEAPAATVRYRLAQARERLRQELGEDDLTYLNEPLAPMRQWAWLPLQEIYALETRLTMGSEAKEDLSMERREFLRQTAAGAAGLVLAGSGQEVVDGRLTQKVTLAFKRTALADLCEHLRSETGVCVAAGPSVADEKVTLFCESMPLRDVMRQLSRPFGYTWVRSARNGQYRYELMQDLRSQLLEEELRNRDRHAALLALEREIERYRPYLDLSPEEARERAQTAPPSDKELVKNLAGAGWGVLQMYFRLSPQELAALRAGETLTFRERPDAGEQSPAELAGWDPVPGGPRVREQSLPPSVAPGALQSLRDFRVLRRGSSFEVGDAKSAPEGVPLTAVPEARGIVILTLRQSELGRFTLGGGAGYAIWSEGQVPWSGTVTHDAYASGISPAAQSPQNPIANARRAQDAGLRRRVTLCKDGEFHRKVTTADVLEALHRATGLPIVADFYTRLYPPEQVSVADLPLFDALNQLADAMRLRWTQDGTWLQFRSASFYDDRLKEVPNRLLSRWMAARQTHGALTLDELIEIAGLTDAQLDASGMAEGAKECWGLAEWDLPCSHNLRPHLRFLATLTPEQRREVTRADGLRFTRLSLAQQQQYLALGPGDFAHRIQSLEELAEATLRVDYTLPGWFRWGAPADPEGRPRPVIGPWPVHEPTREAALHAARRLDTQATDAQLVRTELDVKFVYLWHAEKDRYLRLVDRNGAGCYRPW
jgi:RNA polymerase sigma-70 factor, ECF subfamily